MQFSAGKKKKKVSLYCGLLSLEPSEDCVLLLPVKRKYFNLVLCTKVSEDQLCHTSGAAASVILSWSTIQRSEYFPKCFIKMKNRWKYFHCT